MSKKSKRSLNENEEHRAPPPPTLASFLFSASSPLKQPQREIQSSTQEEQRACYIKKTKKGGVPVAIENRSSGKKVTVIRNVNGDPAELLKGLKQKVGAGGVFKQREGTIEIQGEHVPAVEAFLKSHKFLC